jgi:hypothetical protein
MHVMRLKCRHFILTQLDSTFTSHLYDNRSSLKSKQDSWEVLHQRNAVMSNANQAGDFYGFNVNSYYATGQPRVAIHRAVETPDQ